jgi:chromosome partitioning protein
MVVDHIRQHRAITGEIAHQFGSPRVMAGIRSDIKLAEAFGAGQPIRRYAPRSRAAEDFAALGRCVASLLGPLGPAPSVYRPTWSTPCP